MQSEAQATSSADRSSNARESQIMACASRSLTGRGLVRASRALKSQAMVRASHGLNSQAIQGAKRPSVSRSIASDRSSNTAFLPQANQLKTVQQVSSAQLRPNPSFKRTRLRRSA
jgi:hypothetical protein